MSVEQQIILASSILHETQGRETRLYCKKLRCPFSPRDLHKTGNVMGNKNRHNYYFQVDFAFIY